MKEEVVKKSLPMLFASSHTDKKNIKKYITLHNFSRRVGRGMGLGVMTVGPKAGGALETVPQLFL